MNFPLFKAILQVIIWHDVQISFNLTLHFGEQLKFTGGWLFMVRAL
jgi:hypothetical protein